MSNSAKFWMAVGAIGLAVALAGCFNSTKMNESTPSVTHIAQNDFTNAVIASTKPVVVDFYATWCGPCRALSPMLDRLAPAYTNSVKFVKVNVDESPDVAQAYSIQGIPTLLMFRGGKVADRMVGFSGESDLKAKLDAFASGK
jgi:thioredoxin 1